MEGVETARTAPVLYITRFTIPEGSDGREKHQIEHQAGRELLKTGLQKCFGLDILDMGAQIQTGEKGKPYLPMYPQIHFNISHSGDVAVCALGGSPLGVDVEKLRPVKLHSTRRMLSDRERAFLESCPVERREEVLFRFWTLKESYAKALGVGLGMDFAKIVFPLSMEDIALEEGGIHVARSQGARSGPESPKRERPGGSMPGAMREIEGPKEIGGGGWRFMQLIWEGYVLAFCGTGEPQLSILP